MREGGGRKIFEKKIDVGGGGGAKFFVSPPPPPYDAKWNSPKLTPLLKTSHIPKEGVNH